MGEISTIINRGSEWHRWEPHIHAPGTILADRYPKDSWSRYLDALEAVSPALRVIGVTDYCITRSYERVKVEKDKGRLKQCDMLFPNIELRLNTGTVKGNFVNIQCSMGLDAKRSPQSRIGSYHWPTRVRKNGCRYDRRWG